MRFWSGSRRRELSRVRSKETRTRKQGSRSCQVRVLLTIVEGGVCMLLFLLAGKSRDRDSMELVNSSLQIFAWAKVKTTSYGQVSARRPAVLTGNARKRNQGSSLAGGSDLAFWLMSGAGGFGWQCNTGHFDVEGTSSALGGRHRVRPGGPPEPEL